MFYLLDLIAFDPFSSFTSLLLLYPVLIHKGKAVP